MVGLNMNLEKILCVLFQLLSAKTCYSLQYKGVGRLMDPNNCCSCKGNGFP